MDCLLCQSPNSASFKVEKKPERSYYSCAECDLIFMDPAQRLDPREEKARYDQHENEATAGYSAFFAPLVKNLEEHFASAGMTPDQLTVLDYGSGPTELLSKILTEKGFRAFNYDLYYNPDQEQLRKSYHIITSTEVWEHLYEPRRDIERILRLLKPGGVLGVMTSAHRGEAAFHDWHYRRDTTHVIFFSEKTMQWLADKFRLRFIKNKSPYFIFQKLF